MFAQNAVAKAEFETQANAFRPKLVSVVVLNILAVVNRSQQPHIPR